MKTLWRSLQTKIDMDNEKYKQRCENNAYAAYCRDTPAENRLSREEWNIQRHQTISNDTERHQTISNGPNNQYPITNNQLPTSNNQHSISNKDRKEIKGGVGEKEETRTIPGLVFHPLSPEEFSAKRDAAILSLRAMMEGVGM